MGILSRMRAFLRGGTTTFSRFELAILDAIGNELPPASKDRLKARVRSVNLVCRLDGGREVNCYLMHAGRAVIDQDNRIIDSTGERVLARFKIEGEGGTANSGKAWLVDGRFFSLEFQEPTEHADVADIYKVQVDLNV